MAPDLGVAPAQLNPLQKLLGPLANSIAVPMMLIFGIMYFLIIRPQQQKQKEQEALQKRIAQGDEVFTTGGLVGKVTHATEDILTVEVGDKVRVRVLRTHATLRTPVAADKTATNDKAAADKSISKDKASA
jgi:preprotein translocase subunit YajC